MKAPARFSGSVAVVARAFAVFVMLVAMGVPLLFQGESWAAGRDEAFERWRALDDSSSMQVDHRVWEGFLLNYLRLSDDGVHRLAYGRVTRRDRQALDRYIDRLSVIDLAIYRRAEQLAYWINLYNALSVKLVLEHYPIASIQRLGPADTGNGTRAWQQPLITVDGVDLSLDDIENGILAPISNDSRIHYAASCPALGCPNLQPTPFTGNQLERQLTDAVMAYVNDPRCLEIRDGRLYVSSFYRWHHQAFGQSDRDVIEHLMAYAEPELAMKLQAFDRFHGDRFDWRLNDAAE